jgi:hypothetical protein
MNPRESTKGFQERWRALIIAQENRPKSLARDSTLLTTWARLRETAFGTSLSANLFLKCEIKFNSAINLKLYLINFQYIEQLLQQPPVAGSICSGLLVIYFGSLIF